jgi:phosphohistidine phosphatase SixA
MPRILTIVSMAALRIGATTASSVDETHSSENPPIEAPVPEAGFSETAGGRDNEMHAATPALPGTSKRVIFIRHVESQWNEAKASQSIRKSWGRFFNSDMKDALLSSDGIKQAEKLGAWVDSREDCLRTDLSAVYKKIFGKPKSPWNLGDESAAADCSADVRSYLSLAQSAAWATSNLRRAIATTFYAMGHPLDAAGDKRPDKLSILSALQEVEEGIDARSITPAGKLPVILQGVKSAYSPEGFKWLDLTLNKGDYNEPKMWKHMTPTVRYAEFCAWAAVQTTDTLVVVGHSSWLQKFFMSGAKKECGSSEDCNSHFNMAEHLLTFSDRSKVKLDNGGVIQFELDTTSCKFLPKQTQLVYGTWSVKSNTILGFSKGSKLRTGQKEHMLKVLREEITEALQPSKKLREFLAKSSSLDDFSDTEGDDDEKSTDMGSSVDDGENNGDASTGSYVRVGSDDDEDEENRPTLDRRPVWLQKSMLASGNQHMISPEASLE